MEDISKVANRVTNSSPFLAACFEKYPDICEKIKHDFLSSENPWCSSLKNKIDSINIQPSADRSLKDIVDNCKSEIRRVRAEHLLGLAIADAGGYFTIPQITHSLSIIAVAAVKKAVQASFLINLNRRKKLNDYSDELVDNSGYFVLAMGKLGAGELNYSSDIDLIVIFDPDSEYFTDCQSPADEAVRITKSTVEILQGINAYGNGWRVDLRLRPDPGATQIAVSRYAAENYYASMALTWERAAFIKARSIAGDTRAGDEFLHAISPFVWRRSMDYTAIEEIHNLKRKVVAHTNSSNIRRHTLDLSEHADSPNIAALSGFNIKKDRGGIRDIELFTQVQQLISGGRQPLIRTRATVAAMQQLNNHGWITSEALAELTTIYNFYRRVEHALQAIDDAQTHSLPNNDIGWNRITSLLGFNSAEELANKINEYTSVVCKNYDSLFDNKIIQTTADISEISFDGSDANIETISYLNKLGFKNSELAAETINSWRYGRNAATRNKKSRITLFSIAPQLLSAFAKTINPDKTLAYFDNFLNSLPAGVQLFYLLKSNLKLIDLLRDIIGMAPQLANYLARQPDLLDVMINPATVRDETTCQEYKKLIHQNLKDEQNQEDFLDSLRLVAHEKFFTFGVSLLANSEAILKSQKKHSNLAIAIVDIAARNVWDNYIKNKEQPKSEYAIVAYGRLGAGEMTPLSDLDLVIVYESDSQDSPQNFRRFSLKFISALTAKTSRGGLYEVDTRLRPSGRSGPIAVTLDSFANYNLQDAWTWETLALLRARVITASSSKFAQKVEDSISQALIYPRNSAKILQDSIAMRGKLLTQKSSSGLWGAKNGHGSITDLMITIQAHLLMQPEIIASNNYGIQLGSFSSTCFTYNNTLDWLNILGKNNPNFADQKITNSWKILNTTTHLAALCLGEPEKNHENMDKNILQHFLELLKLHLKNDLDKDTALTEYLYSNDEDISYDSPPQIVIEAKKIISHVADNTLPLNNAT